jgi:imidazolonepropionase-like amidohydrolase
MKLLTAAATVVVALAGADATPQPRTAGAVVLTGSRIVDARAGAYRTGQALLIRNGKIEAVGPVPDIRARAPRDATNIDLAGATLLPGLIDAHAHLLDGMEGAWRPGDAIVLTLTRLGAARRALLGAQMAREDLEAGVTSVRNLGHSGINGDAALRDAINDGAVPGPRMLAATRKITPPGGQAVVVQSDQPDQLIDQEFLQVSGPEEARRAVRVAMANGADVIKIVADDRGRVLDADEISAIVREAHRGGLKVAAHATTEIGIRAAVDGGVDSVEHGSRATDELFTRMREKGIVLVPTFWGEQMYKDIYGPSLTPDERADIDRQVKVFADATRATIARARRAGVKMVAGTDMSFRYPGKTRGEATVAVIAAMQDAGFSAPDVIRAATVDAAELLGWGDRVGTLEAGRFADVVALNGEPLADAKELTKIQFVMKGGVVVRNELTRATSSSARR